MLRKTVLGAAAALTLGVAAIAPTAASAGGAGIHLHVGGFGGGYWGPGYGYWGPACYFKKVKVWSPYHGHFVWKKKKICY